MIDRLKDALVQALSKELLIDLYDMIVARALAAHELIRDNTDLDDKNARAAAGQVRFRIQEKGFHDVCVAHGGQPLIDNLLPGTDLRVFQPFMRFQSATVGVILGLASMPERGALPTKNMSRRAGVALNVGLMPRLDLGDACAKPGDIFVLLLAARDPQRAGKVEEVAIGIVDDEYESFVFYEPIENFLSGYAAPAHDEPAASPAAPLVRLKSHAKPFVGPESQVDAEDDDSESGAA